jgi:hypothetical protein
MEHAASGIVQRESFAMPENGVWVCTSIVRRNG